MVAFGDVRVHVPVAASEHHPEPWGGVPLGQHAVLRPVVLGSNSIDFSIEIQMTNLVSHQIIFEATFCVILKTFNAPIRACTGPS